MADIPILNDRLYTETFGTAEYGPLDERLGL